MAENELHLTSFLLDLYKHYMVTGNETDLAAY